MANLTLPCLATPVKPDNLRISITPRDIPQFKKAAELSEQDNCDPANRRNTLDPTDNVTDPIVLVNNLRSL